MPRFLTRVTFEAKAIADIRSQFTEIEIIRTVIPTLTTLRDLLLHSRGLPDGNKPIPIVHSKARAMTCGKIIAFYTREESKPWRWIFWRRTHVIDVRVTDLFRHR